ncbi:MAG: response regulator [Phycisphaerae bacterium]|nr:response regulator [Phycisphaerae bacterium]
MLDPVRESARLAELDRLKVVGSAPEPLFDEIARVASLLCDAPFAAVSLVGDQAEWFKARWGLDLPPACRDQALCAAVVDSGKLLVVPDATADDRFAALSSVRDTGIRLYAGAPIRSSNGQFVGAVCVKDRRKRELQEWQVSGLEGLARVAGEALEFRLLALEIERARAAAEEANRAKSSFLANMSHEIRTPLNAILGFANLLADGAATPAEQREYAETIRSSSDHLLTMINDVLDLSSLEAGNMPVERTDVDVARLVRDAAAMLEPRAVGKGIAMTCQTPAGRVLIKSDPIRLRQVLLNLIGNAVKFTELGGVTVSLTSSDLPPDRKRITVEIADTGIGISPEKLPTIFNPFNQSDSSLTRRFGGSGLGLAISDRLARALGASLHVASTLGKGSVFTFTIDAAVGLRTGGATPQVVNLRDPSALDMNILYAEDGPDNQRLVSFLLKMAGANVALADNGRIAVDLIKGGARFDLVLMDMQMPELDGYQATRELRAAGYELPIVALTAHAMADDRGKCLIAGCDDFLTKPIDRELLIATCRRWKKPGGRTEKSVA